jgi:hypothetical protein
MLLLIPCNNLPLPEYLLLATTATPKLPAAPREPSVALNNRPYHKSATHLFYMGCRVWLVLAAVFATAASHVAEGEPGATATEVIIPFRSCTHGNNSRLTSFIR